MLLILFEGGGHYSRGLHRRGIFLVEIKENCSDPEVKAYLKHFFSQGKSIPSGDEIPVLSF